MEKSRILQKILKQENLPSPSPILVHLLRLASEDNTSINDLARVIEKDPGLTARLIRMANMAHYSRGRKVSTISEAIFVVGFNRLRVMALSISIRDSFPYGRLGGMDYERFWNMSLYRAIISQDLIQSKMFRISASPEEAFMAALILEIGILILYQVCPEDLRDSFPGGLAPLEEALRWEEEHIGVNHREVAYMVLKRWRFPDHITELQKYWGNRAWGEAAPELARLMEYARVCTHVFYGTMSDFSFIQEAGLRLGADIEKVNEILGRTFLRVEEVACELLNLQIDINSDMLEIMEKANRALARISLSLEHDLSRIIDLVSDENEPHEGIDPDAVDPKRQITEDILEAVAHEIRNPLVAIGGFARRMANVVEGRGDLQKYADIIIQESTRLESLLNEIIAYSQQYEPNLDLCDLVELVNESIDELQHPAESGNIEIVRRFTQGPVYALIDTKAFKKTIGLLLVTAIRYAKRSGKGDMISLETTFGLTGRGLEISISGNCLEIPHDLQKVFSTIDFSSKTLGYGLGLGIARKIVEAHNGRLELKNENGGTGFVILLPGENGQTTGPVVRK